MAPFSAVPFPKERVNQVFLTVSTWKSCMTVMVWNHFRVQREQKLFRAQYIDPVDPLEHFLYLQLRTTNLCKKNEDWPYVGIFHAYVYVKRRIEDCVLFFIGECHNFFSPLVTFLVLSSFPIYTHTCENISWKFGSLSPPIIFTRVFVILWIPVWKKWGETPTIHAHNPYILISHLCMT